MGQGAAGVNAFATDVAVVAGGGNGNPDLFRFRADRVDGSCGYEISRAPVTVESNTVLGFAEDATVRFGIDLPVSEFLHVTSELPRSVALDATFIDIDQALRDVARVLGSNPNR